MTCPNCGCEDHEFLLIDCRLPLGSVERETIRYCFSCRPSARHPYANCLPQIIRNADILEAEKKTALAARRYVVDRRASYSIVERLFDLGISPTANWTRPESSVLSSFRLSHAASQISDPKQFTNYLAIRRAWRIR